MLRALLEALRYILLIPLISLAGLALVSSNQTVYAAPRVWTINQSTTGYAAASNTAAPYVSTFNPKNLAFCNDASAGGHNIWVDFTGATAVITSKTAIAVFPGECHHWTFYDPDVTSTFQISIITDASTSHWRVEGTR